MGWNDENIIEELGKDVTFIPQSISLGQIKIFVYGVGYSSQTDWFHAGPGYTVNPHFFISIMAIHRRYLFPKLKILHVFLKFIKIKYAKA